MPGLDPGISINLAQCLDERDGRVKPGHDTREKFTAEDAACNTRHPRRSVSSRRGRAR
jgi:hypothetical protein